VVSLLNGVNNLDNHDSYIANYRNTGNAAILGSSEREVPSLHSDGSTITVHLSVIRQDNEADRSNWESLVFKGTLKRILANPVSVKSSEVPKFKYSEDMLAVVGNDGELHRGFEMSTEKLNLSKRDNEKKGSINPLNVTTQKQSYDAPFEAEVTKDKMALSKQDPSTAVRASAAKSTTSLTNGGKERQSLASANGGGPKHSLISIAKSGGSKRSGNSSANGSVNYHEKIKVIRESIKLDPVVATLNFRFKVTMLILIVTLIGSAFFSIFQNVYLETMIASSDVLLHILSASNMIIGACREMSYISEAMPTSGPCSWKLNTANASTLICPFLLEGAARVTWEERVKNDLDSAIEELTLGVNGFRERYANFKIPNDEMDTFLSDIPLPIFKYQSVANPQNRIAVSYETFWSLMDDFRGSTEAVADQFLNSTGRSQFELTTDWYFLLGMLLFFSNPTGNRENIFRMNTDLISLLADRMDNVYRTRGTFNLIIPIAFSGFALILFHIYILPTVLKASNRRYEVLKVLVGIPQSSILQEILPKYEDEIDDMDDEQEAQIATKSLKKDSVKVLIKKEINKKLYFLMVALFASITIMEIVYQIYNVVRAPNELVVYQTMKSMVCFAFPLKHLIIVTIA
jgi:hypothetical protein